MTHQRAWLLVLASLCFIGVFGGLAEVGILPEYTITIAFGFLGMLIIASYPMFGLFLFLFSLYFPVFPSVTVGPIEFSMSTILVVGLMIGIIKSSVLSTENTYLFDWQRPILFALGTAFALTSPFSSSFNATMSFIPNLVIYLSILFVLMKFVNKPEKLLYDCEIELGFRVYFAILARFFRTCSLIIPYPQLGWC